MNSDQKDTSSKQGAQTGKDNSQSDTATNRSAGKQGGTPEQHAEAGRQSHKSRTSQGTGSGRSTSGSDTASGNRQSESGGKGASGGQSGSKSGSTDNASESRSGGIQGGTHEQHVEAGRQSHKNTK